MSSLLFFISVCILIQIDQINCQCGPRDGYYADTAQCDKYVYCEGGHVVEEGLCPDGLVFNEYGDPSRVRCELGFNIDCSLRPALQTAQPSGDCPRKYGMYRHPSDCTSFIECSDGQAFYKTCPQGLAFNDETGNCDWPENTPYCPAEDILGFTCPDATPQEIALYGHPRYPHSHDCKMLFACVSTSNEPGERRQPRLLGCDEGLVFNAELGVCDYPENVKGCEHYYSTQPERIESPNRYRYNK